MDPAFFGYIRVSQAEGEGGLATQRRILTDHGLRDGRIFTDVASGRNMRRPAWTTLREKLQPGDVVVVPPAGPEPHRGSQGHRGAARPGHPHPLPCGGPGHGGRQPNRPAHAALPG